MTKDFANFADFSVNIFSLTRIDINAVLGLEKGNGQFFHTVEREVYVGDISCSKVFGYSSFPC